VLVPARRFGKNTTLYAALSELNNEQVNICSVEDPVECHIHGINQFEVHVRGGFRSPLRFAASASDPTSSWSRNPRS
jgi:type II secretory ATPase GspE/PulE/Tfp pilus assembly ATPase PilB-like protein